VAQIPKEATLTAPRVSDDADPLTLAATLIGEIGRVPENTLFFDASVYIKVLVQINGALIVASLAEMSGNPELR
jgi:hypothetical protein